MLEDTNYHLNVGRDAIKFRQGSKYENVIRHCFPSLVSVKKKKESRKSHSDTLVDDGDDGEWITDNSMVHDSSYEANPKYGGGFVGLPSAGMRKVIKDGAHVARYQYVYWDDPNELVHRLQLLHMSRLAGNTSANNEISSIEEELRERKLIY